MREGTDSNRNPSECGAGAGLARAGARSLCIALTVGLALSACGESSNGDESSKVNGSIEVHAGKQPGAVATVNGSIQIDDNATITSATTVNGSVHLGNQATATSLNSVNGSITLGAGAHVSGSASSVNGELNLKDGAEISGSLSNVNGKITLTTAHVAGGIKTINGSMTIVGASHVENGILVEKPSSELPQTVQQVPRIVIGPGVTVQGDLRFERAVQLFVSDKATIGTVTGATAIAYSGDSPPN
jgi:acyl-[acyl carrier protein]--UDP-N-acetylglucosamine O-acyltransferase